MNRNDLIGGSPALLHTLERLDFELQIVDFNESKHLTEREKPYCTANLLTQGIFVVRETGEGWWRESIDFKGDREKQIVRLANDPTITLGWTITPRFTEPGGWHDPS